MIRKKVDRKSMNWDSKIQCKIPNSQPKPAYKVQLCFKDMFICYLKGSFTDREGEIKRNLPFAGLLPK